MFFENQMTSVLILLKNNDIFSLISVRPTIQYISTSHFYIIWYQLKLNWVSKERNTAYERWNQQLQWSGYIMRYLVSRETTNNWIEET